MKHNYALYYPTIEFQNYDWLYSASLIWDRIYRIVPESYTPHDPSNIRELVESGEIGIYLSPDRYAKLIADEFNEELNQDSKDDFEGNPDNFEATKELPSTYNETTIDVVLRNPAWAYVYWDISASDLQDVINAKGFTKLLLRVHFWESERADKVEDVCELTISEEDRAQYIFLPAGKKYFSIDLVAEFSNVEPQKLSKSRVVVVPAGAPVISLESLDKPVSPILQLSGMQELLKSHYQNHRQSFS